MKKKKFLVLDVETANNVNCPLVMIQALPYVINTVKFTKSNQCLFMKSTAANGN